MGSGPLKTQFNFGIFHRPQLPSLTRDPTDHGGGKRRAGHVISHAAHKMGFMAALVVAHDKAGMRRGVLYLGLGVSPAEYALLASGTAFCEDVGPFQSSKTKAALAAFFLRCSP